MSVKGKEKAVDLEVAEPTALDDDLDSFFVKKTKRKHLPKYSPVRSPSPVLILDDSDDEDARARAKKAKPKKSSARNQMPEWTRRSASSGDARKRQLSGGRGSTEERKDGKNVNETITIESSPEKEQPEDRGELELTPPPDLTESKKAEIAQAVQSAIALRPAGQPTVFSSSKSQEESPVRPSTSAVDDIVKGYFRMVAPPDMKANEGDKEVERYERVRTITMGKTQPLSYAIGALASQVKKLSSEIVVTYKGDKIYSTTLTPQSLGIEYDADFVCYEKAYYDRMESEAREKRRRADADARREEEEAAAGGPDASQSSEPAQAEDSGKARITLLGDFGQVSAVVHPHVTALNLCKYYLQKTKQDKSQHNSYRLSLDGEIIEPSTPFSDMDVDDGEQMDVVRV